ncbi:RNA-binding motif, single-stranded-interacting protein 3-like isoform X2 [Durio zibethinus]|uniref:RNA-binding motif, single-stranded-interacting protein 3-like isoform X2 n=1 Tax=Durio zibethinus TaxID=66656 RepID=A0A6P6AAU6_DURZI|nr:RNA-binding motif, single-stranded-interacting protein 3-like isoform X2 [Durio zibethinus]XP_022762005.1 RNA-binding motif, single-stranded-interacting protein 3-like isoform X2 [Durio zibethinus]
MALLWQCPSPLFSSLQLSKLFTINPKRSISNTHSSKSFRISFPSLTHQPICCSNFSSESESYSSSSTGVFIKGLPRSTAEGHLMKVFWQFGEVKQVNVVGERVSKQCLGSGFVWFDKSLPC